MPYKNAEDQRQGSRQNYYRHKATYRERNRRQRQTAKELIQSLKERCTRCGFTGDPVALDFHHRDGENKDVEIATMPRRGWGKERILAELAKCDVLCANCHRIEHLGNKTS